MTRRSTSFLTSSVQTLPFTVRISATVKEQLQLLEGRLAKEASHLAFDRSQVVEVALSEAIRLANAELDAAASSPARSRST